MNGIREGFLTRVHVLPPRTRFPSIPCKPANSADFGSRSYRRQTTASASLRSFPAPTARHTTASASLRMFPALSPAAPAGGPLRCRAKTGSASRVDTPHCDSWLHRVWRSACGATMRPPRRSNELCSVCSHLALWRKVRWGLGLGYCRLTTQPATQAAGLGWAA